MDVAVLVKPARLDPARPKAEDGPELSPADRPPLAAARGLAARHGAEVTLVAASHADDDTSLRAGLRQAGDRAVLVADERLAGADPWGTAHALEAAVRHAGGADVVLAGLEGPHRGTGATGPRVAQLLDAALLPRATELDVAPGEDALEATRRGADADQRLRGPLPALATVHRDHRSSLSSVRARLAARDHDARRGPVAKAPDAVETVDLDALDVHANLVGRAGSPTRVVDQTAPDPPSAGPGAVHGALDDDALGDTAEALIEQGGPA